MTVSDLLGVGLIGVQTLAIIGFLVLGLREFHD